MRHLTLLATTATLVLAAPAFAQDAPVATPAPQAAPAPATEPAEAPTPEEQAIQAQGEAFGQRMEALQGEIQAAAVAAGADSAKARADADVIVARYQPEADAFGDVLSAFILTQGDTDEEKAQVAAAAPGVAAQIKLVPTQIRDGVLQASVAQQAAPAPAAPAPTPAPQ